MPFPTDQGMIAVVLKNFGEGGDVVAILLVFVLNCCWKGGVVLEEPLVARNIPSFWISTLLFTHNTHASDVVVRPTEEHGSRRTTRAGSVI